MTSPQTPSNFLPLPPTILPELTQAARILKQGRLVAFPTETVYGLGANAEDSGALARLFAVKGRPTNHPVIVHIASAAQLSDWTREVPPEAVTLANVFWPGPLTLILKRSSRVPDAVTGGQDTVGIRVPGHPLTLALLKEFNGGIAGPSANRFGKLSPTQASHVREDLGNDVDLILDGGTCPVGVESTIVAFQADGRPIVLRPGMITAEQIEAVLTTSQTTGYSDETELIRAPGTLASHYAPNTRTQILSASALAAEPASDTTGVLAIHTLPSQTGAANWFQMPDQPKAYAQQLYARLRELDHAGLTRILVEEVPTHGEWAAVADRLQRAAFKG